MHWGRITLIGLAGGSVATLGWEIFRQIGLVLSLSEVPWLERLIVASLGACAALIGGLITTLGYRRQLRLLAEMARTQRENPGPGSLELGRRSLSSTRLRDVWEELEALAVSYRAALSELVQTREQLEPSSPALGPLTPRSGMLPAMMPTHFVVGSSRHR